jgi:hypothetical protein
MWTTFLIFENLPKVHKQSPKWAKILDAQPKNALVNTPPPKKKLETIATCAPAARPHN